MLINNIYIILNMNNKNFKTYRLTIKGKLKMLAFGIGLAI
jgi:hypothetical protein